MVKKTLAVLVLCFFAQLIFAQGDLLINPVRVVFEGQKTVEDLSLTNIGKDSATFMVSFVSYKMQEDGSFVQLEKADSTQSADKFLRLFPRKISLAPAESQTIRMQLRKPSGLKDGEYRSHLYFRAEKEKPALGMALPKTSSNAMSIQITPIFGISIPVIVRHGSLSSNVTLSEASFEVVNDSVGVVSVCINRDGYKSAYGNLVAEYTSEKSKKGTVIGFENGVGVYTEIPKRYIRLSVRYNQEMKLNNGKVVLKYVQNKPDGSTDVVQSEVVIK